MRFGSIYLKNYIGIYNGMGLREIFINFTIGKHRTTIIRGDNGSGKSTIMKALSVFPDGNDQFIPGEEAKKEIVLIDGAVVYVLTFIHGVKSNGQREVTKAYIIKRVNGVDAQLNENGNVTSFKDVLYDELGLDPNFESLSQLSTDDRGIADKKPADRKRFVNSILNNLEVYNDIYKTLTKRSTSFKNLISSISAKLGSIGDQNVIASNIAGIEAKINEAQDRKDQAIEKLANSKAKMDMLDPDGSIQAIIKKIEDENTGYQKDLDKIKSIITSSRLGNNVTLVEDINTLITDTKAAIDNLNIDNQINRGKIESFLRERESEANELASKIQRLQSFEQEWRYEDICDEIAKNEAEKKEIEAVLSVTEIKDILSFSKESYITALNAIKNIIERVDFLKDSCEYSILSDVLDDYIHHGVIPNMIDTGSITLNIASTEKEINDLNIFINNLIGELKVLESLKLRPAKCKIDSCPFISEAISIQKHDPRCLLEEDTEKLNKAKSNLKMYQEALEIATKTNSCINLFSNLIRDIDRIKPIIFKLPCANLFINKQSLINGIFNGNYLEYFDQIYQYIEYANFFDRYKAIDDALTKLYAERSIYESKQDILTEVQSDIDKLNIRIADIDKLIAPIQSKLAFNDKSLIKLQKDLGIYQSIADNEKERDRILKLIDDNDKLYKANMDKITKFNEASKLAIKQTEVIESINREMNPLIHERDRLNHQMRLVDDYNRELAQLNTQYNIIETIRYYSSPTTGIQLVFMEMYMGKVIEVANNLLSMFFNGQFRIMPFVINESEFRIPCAGEGIMNDDISSMSSAQIAMISMILSFSFLYSSSSRYNILKLDEIDGPLDANNRIMFIDVLNNVMNMMGTEQCIMISHNSELQVDDADIILLKSSENNDYMHGNIIWKY